MWTGSLLAMFSGPLQRKLPEISVHKGPDVRKSAIVKGLHRGRKKVAYPSLSSSFL